MPNRVRRHLRVLIVKCKECGKPVQVRVHKADSEYLYWDVGCSCALTTVNYNPNGRWEIFEELQGEELPNSPEGR